MEKEPILEYVKQRLGTPITITFVISDAIWNWHELAILFFGKGEKEDRINFFNIHLNCWDHLFGPLILAIFLVCILLFLTMISTWAWKYCEVLRNNVIFIIAQRQTLTVEGANKIYKDNAKIRKELEKYMADIDDKNNKLNAENNELKSQNLQIKTDKAQVDERIRKLSEIEAVAKIVDRILVDRFDYDAAYEDLRGFRRASDINVQNIMLKFYEFARRPQEKEFLDDEKFINFLKEQNLIIEVSNKIYFTNKGCYFIAKFKDAFN